MTTIYSCPYLFLVINTSMVFALNLIKNNRPSQNIQHTLAGFFLMNILMTEYTNEIPLTTMSTAIKTQLAITLGRLSGASYLDTTVEVYSSVSKSISWFDKRSVSCSN